MRPEIEKVKEIMQKAANNARLYHENISRVRRTCKPEHILEETKVFSDPLRESMCQAAADVEDALKGLEATLKEGCVIRGEDYDAATMAAIKALEPDAAELTEIGKRYDGNETMLRALRQHITTHKISGVTLPASAQAKLDALGLLRGDITYIIKQAGNGDPNENRYQDAMLRHIAENFDTVFTKQIADIGE